MYNILKTRISDKKKREISDCLNDTLTNLCGQKFAKTTLPSKTENMSNVGSNEKNSSDINTTDVDLEWTVSVPEGGIAIIPVTNTEYHPLLEGSGATGYGIDTNRRQYALGHSDQDK
jgi:hypothetical protein